MILLIRHADAGSRERWAGDDRRRPLSAKGLRQAEGLAAELAPLRPQRILSSPYRRCLQSVEPLAARLGLPVLRSAALAESAQPARFLRLLEDAADRTTVLCTHGDVIPAVLEHLASRGADFEDQPSRWAKGSVWAIERELTGRHRLRYLPPPA